MKKVRLPMAFLAGACLLAAGVAAHAKESESYTAYAEGKYLTALEFAEKEAKDGSKEAYTLIGEIYSEGLGVPQDYAKAADSYAKAADLGDPNAQFSLGLLVAEGRGRGHRDRCRPGYGRRRRRGARPKRDRCR